MVHYIDKSLSPKSNKRESNGNSDEERPKGFFARKFLEFCKRTDLHGYKYIVMKDLSIFERICWAVAVAVSTGFAIFFVITAYHWYARNPIVTVIESTQGAIWDVPFPAVTVCNLNIVSRKEAAFFSKNVSLPTNVTSDEVMEALQVAPLLHAYVAATKEQKELLHKLQTVLDLNNIEVTSLFKRISPSSKCDQFLRRCMWKNTIYRCESLFEQVLTYFGVCCTFNYYAIEDGLVKAKVSPDMIVEAPERPRRVASCGYQTALSVLLETHPEDYYSSAVASQGAMVIIDNAYNVADLDSPVRLVNPDTEVLIALSPERTYTTAGIRAFTAEDRQCYYADEKKVGVFKHYSFHNCMAHQRVQYINKVCECMPYYFTVKGYHRICNFKDIDCLQTLRGTMPNDSEIAEKEGMMNCLPECEHFDYPLEVALGKLARTLRLDERPFFTDLRLENSSLVNVFFNDLVSTRYRRDVYFNWQNLLASFGGLLSLMLGFTLISGFDLIIFFTFGLVQGSVCGGQAEARDAPAKQQSRVKNNTIYVREQQKIIDNYMKKKNNGKDLRKWHTEVNFGASPVRY